MIKRPEQTVIEDMPDAIIFATAAHEGQEDWKGRPYIFHPIAVAEKAWMIGLPLYACIAAVLHDTVEDTEVTLDMIDGLAGREVSDMVDFLTRRKGQTYEQFIDRLIASKNKLAMRVKILDIQDNLREDRRMKDEGELSRRKRYRNAIDSLYDGIEV